MDAKAKAKESLNTADSLFVDKGTILILIHSRSQTFADSIAATIK